VLHGYDNNVKDAKVHGSIYYGLAFNACAIIADNCYDGWLGLGYEFFELESASEPLN
jgi:hypothetical protein